MSFLGGFGSSAPAAASGPASVATKSSLSAKSSRFLLGGGGSDGGSTPDASVAAKSGNMLTAKSSRWLMGGGSSDGGGKSSPAPLRSSASGDESNDSDSVGSGRKALVDGPVYTATFEGVPDAATARGVASISVEGGEWWLQLEGLCVANVPVLLRDGAFLVLSKRTSPRSLPNMKGTHILTWPASASGALPPSMRDGLPLFRVPLADIVKPPDIPGGDGASQVSAESSTVNPRKFKSLLIARPGVAASDGVTSVPSIVFAYANFVPAGSSSQDAAAALADKLLRESVNMAGFSKANTAPINLYGRSYTDMDALARDAFAALGKTKSDGELTFAEFKMVLATLNVPFTEPRAYAWFDLADEDGSGAIEFEEFQHLLFMVSAAAPAEYLTLRDVAFFFTNTRAMKGVDAGHEGKEEEEADAGGPPAALEFDLPLIGVNELHAILNSFPGISGSGVGGFMGIGGGKEKGLTMRKVEKLFRSQEARNVKKGGIHYAQVREIWLALIDPRTELGLRGTSASAAFASGAVMATDRGSLRAYLGKLCDEEDAAIVANLTAAFEAADAGRKKQVADKEAARRAAVAAKSEEHAEEGLDEKAIKRKKALMERGERERLKREAAAVAARMELDATLRVQMEAAIAARSSAETDLAVVESSSAAAAEAEKRKRLGMDRLDLSVRGLTYLPSLMWSTLEATTRLSELVILDLSGNALRVLPAKSLFRHCLRLQKLDLSANTLDMLPEDLTECTSLRLLSLHLNALTVLPESLGRLTQLRRLTVYGNVLTSLPESIGECTALQVLHAQANSLASLPSSIGRCVELMELNAAGNKLAFLPSSLCDAVKLERVDLRNNVLRELPTTIGRLKRLQVLVLSNNSLRDLPPAIGKCKKLLILDFCRNRVNGIPETLSRCASLMALLGAENQILALPASVFEGLASLQTLNFASNRLVSLPPSIGRLTELQAINLSKNALTSIPDEFGALRSLRHLDLHSNCLGATAPIGEPALPSTMGTCVSLEWLDLSRNGAKAVHPSLSGCPRLQHLNLADNALATHPAALAGMPSLLTLDLSNNELVHIASELGRCISLRALDLSCNKLKAVPESLGDCAALRHLHLYSNRITVLPPSTAWLMPQLLSFDIGRNPLSGLPQKWAAGEVFGARDVLGLRFTREAREPLIVELRRARARALFRRLHGVRAAAEDLLDHERMSMLLEDTRLRRKGPAAVVAELSAFASRSGWSRAAKGTERDRLDEWVAFIKAEVVAVERSAASKLVAKERRDAEAMEAGAAADFRARFGSAVALEDEPGSAFDMPGSSPSRPVTQGSDGGGSVGPPLDPREVAFRASLRRDDDDFSLPPDSRGGDRPMWSRGGAPGRAASPPDSGYAHLLKRGVSFGAVTEGRPGTEASRPSTTDGRPSSRSSMKKGYFTMPQHGFETAMSPLRQPPATELARRAADQAAGDRWDPEVRPRSAPGTAEAPFLSEGQVDVYASVILKYGAPLPPEPPAEARASPARGGAAEGAASFVVSHLVAPEPSMDHASVQSLEGLEEEGSVLMGSIGSLPGSSGSEGEGDGEGEGEGKEESKRNPRRNARHRHLFEKRQAALAKGSSAAAAAAAAKAAARAERIARKDAVFRPQGSMVESEAPGALLPTMESALDGGRSMASMSAYGSEEEEEAQPHPSAREELPPPEPISPPSVSPSASRRRKEGHPSPAIAEAAHPAVALAVRAAPAHVAVAAAPAHVAVAAAPAHVVIPAAPAHIAIAAAPAPVVIPAAPCVEHPAPDLREPTEKHVLEAPADAAAPEGEEPLSPAPALTIDAEDKPWMDRITARMDKEKEKEKERAAKGKSTAVVSGGEEGLARSFLPAWVKEEGEGQTGKAPSSAGGVAIAEPEEFVSALPEYLRPGMDEGGQQQGAVDEEVIRAARRRSLLRSLGRDPTPGELAAAVSRHMGATVGGQDGWASGNKGAHGYGGGFESGAQRGRRASAHDGDMMGVGASAQRSTAVLSGSGVHLNYRGGRRRSSVLGNLQRERRTEELVAAGRAVPWRMLERADRDNRVEFAGGDEAAAQAAYAKEQAVAVAHFKAVPASKPSAEAAPEEASGPWEGLARTGLAHGGAPARRASVVLDAPPVPRRQEAEVAEQDGSTLAVGGLAPTTEAERTLWKARLRAEVADGNTGDWSSNTHGLGSDESTLVMGHGAQVGLGMRTRALALGIDASQQGGVDGSSAARGMALGTALMLSGATEVDGRGKVGLASALARSGADVEVRLAQLEADGDADAVLVVGAATGSNVRRLRAMQHIAETRAAAAAASVEIMAATKSAQERDIALIAAHQEKEDHVAKMKASAEASDRSNISLPAEAGGLSVIPRPQAPGIRADGLPEDIQPRSVAEARDFGLAGAAAAAYTDLMRSGVLSGLQAARVEQVRRAGEVRDEPDRGKRAAAAAAANAGLSDMQRLPIAGLGPGYGIGPAAAASSSGTGAGTEAGQGGSGEADPVSGIITLSSTFAKDAVDAMFARAEAARKVAAASGPTGGRQTLSALYGGTKTGNPVAVVGAPAFPPTAASTFDPQRDPSAVMRADPYVQSRAILAAPSTGIRTHMPGYGEGLTTGLWGGDPYAQAQPLREKGTAGAAAAADGSFTANPGALLAALSSMPTPEEVTGVSTQAAVRGRDPPASESVKERRVLQGKRLETAARDTRMYRYLGGVRFSSSGAPKEEGEEGEGGLGGQPSLHSTGPATHSGSIILDGQGRVAEEPPGGTLPMAVVRIDNPFAPSSDGSGGAVAAARTHEEVMAVLLDRGDHNRRPEPHERHAPAANMRGYTSGDVAEFVRLESVYAPYAEAEWYARAGAYLEGRAAVADFVKAVRRRMQGRDPLTGDLIPTGAEGYRAGTDTGSAADTDARHGAWEPLLVPLVRRFFSSAYRTGLPPAYGSLTAEQAAARAQLGDVVARYRSIAANRVTSSLTEQWAEYEALYTVAPGEIEARIVAQEERGKASKSSAWQSLVGGLQADVKENAARAVYMAQEHERRKREALKAKYGPLAAAVNAATEERQEALIAAAHEAGLNADAALSKRARLNAQAAKLAGGGSMFG